jgi:hypothetical protein
MPDSIHHIDTKFHTDTIPHGDTAHGDTAHVDTAHGDVKQKHDDVKTHEDVNIVPPHGDIIKGGGLPT